MKKLIVFAFLLIFQISALYSGQYMSTQITPYNFGVVYPDNWDKTKLSYQVFDKEGLFMESYHNGKPFHMVILPSTAKKNGEGSRPQYDPTAFCNAFGIYPFALEEIKIGNLNTYKITANITKLLFPTKFHQFYLTKELISILYVIHIYDDIFYIEFTSLKKDFDSMKDDFEKVARSFYLY